MARKSPESFEISRAIGLAIAESFNRKLLEPLRDEDRVPTYEEIIEGTIPDGAVLTQEEIEDISRAWQEFYRTIEIKRRQKIQVWPSDWPPAQANATLIRRFDRWLTQRNGLKQAEDKAKHGERT